MRNRCACGHYCYPKGVNGLCCSCKRPYPGMSPPGPTATGGSTMSKKYAIFTDGQAQDAGNGTYTNDDEKQIRDKAETLARAGKVVTLYERKAVVKTSHPPVAWDDQAAEPAKK